MVFITLGVGVSQSPLEPKAPSVPPRVEQARRFLQHRAGVTGSVAVSLVPRANATVQGLASAGSTAAWQPLGPTAVLTPAYGLVTGRVSSIAIDPADATGNHVYVGTTGGGVWVSQNAASSGNVVFSPLTDSSSPFSGLRYGSISIGAVTVQPGGTGVVLAGTGDPNDALDSYYGAGVLRSTDGGSTWTAVSLTKDQLYSFTGEGFAGFAWSTANPQLVVAAVSQAYEGTLVNAPLRGRSYAGLYYSTDAGATWSLARITDGTGKDVQGPSNAFASPNGNSATAVVWNPIRQVFIAAVRFHGYYQSTDGVTWTRLTAQPGTGLTAQMCPNNPGAIGSIACPIFRGALAVNPVSGDTFAWTVDLYNQDQGLWQDVCAVSGGTCSAQSVAFAQQWSTLPLRTNTFWGPATINNGDYNLALAAVPSAQDTILLAGANDVWRCSLAMGCSWRNTTNAYTCMSAQVAPYQHALAWNLANPQEILIGNDSGLWRSMDAIAEAGAVCSPDDATHFQNLNAGLGSLAEVDSVAQGLESPYTMMAGLGVNGTAGVKSASGPTSTWPQVVGGEGGPVAIGSGAPANWYVNNSAGVSIHRCSQEGECTPDAFGAQAAVDNADVAGDGYTMTTPAPFIVDPLDASQILVGTCRVWRGPADGSSWTAANAITPLVDGIAGHAYCSGDPLIRSIAALPSAGGGEVIYAGMFGSANGGAMLGGHVLKTTFVPGSASQSQWSDLTFNPVANNLPFNQYGLDISRIFIDRHDPTGNTVYVTVAGIPDIYHPICTVYRSTDGGLHWYGLNSNIIASPANSFVIDPQDANTAYLATDAGVYATRQVSACTVGNSNCWSAFGTGLPFAPVTQLSAAPASGSLSVLVAGTYGRGIWQIPLWTAGTQQTSASVDPASLEFSTLVVGTASPAQTVTLKNTGGIALAVSSITADPPFTAMDNCIGKTINAGASCTVQVVFAPNQVGAVSGQLRISANVPGGEITVSLAGTGASAGGLRTSPGLLDFGQVAIGKTSTWLTVTLENATTSTIAIANITATPPFSVAANPCGASVAANSSCAVSIAFLPTQGGPVTGTLGVVDNAGTQIILLKGTGANDATDALSAASLTFGPTAVGQQSSRQVVTLSNDGELALNGITATASAGFHSSDTCGGSLGPHAACSISVVFAPTTTGMVDGILTVTDAIRSQTVTLSGTALSAPTFRTSSSQLSFPATAVGQASAPMTLTVSNSGGAPLADVGFQISGAAASSFSSGQSTCGATLQGGGSCTVQLTFTPAQAGQLSATLVVSSSSSGVSPVQVALSGVGQGQTKITISPTQLSFVQLRLGESTGAQMATIANTSDVTALQLAVSASAPFSVAQSTCGSSLGPRGTCSVGVVFTPTGNAVVNGNLSVSSITFADPAIAFLTGTGGAAGSVQMQPGSLAFPITGVGMTSASQSVTLTNNGPVAFSDLVLSAGAGFRVASSTCSASLPISGSCTAQIVFSPTSAGQQTGNLSAASASLAAPAQIALSGTGFDFSLGISGQSSKTVASGQTATYGLTLTPLGGSAGTFSFSCSALPARSSCSFNPTSVSVPGNSAGSVTVNIATGLGQSNAASAVLGGRNYLPSIMFFIALPIAFVSRRKKRWMMVFALAAIGIAGCAGAGGGGGGAPGSPNQNTPAGTYSVVVTASANGVSHQTTVTVVVD